MREWTVLRLRLPASPHLAAATQPLALTAPGFGSASPGLSPASLGLGPVSPGLGPVSSGFGPASPDLSPTSLGLGPLSSGFGPMSPGFGPISSRWSLAQHPPSGTSRRNQTRISDPPDSHHSGQKEAVLSRSLAPAWLPAPEASRKLPGDAQGSGRLSCHTCFRTAPEARGRNCLSPSCA